MRLRFLLGRTVGYEIYLIGEVVSAGSIPQALTKLFEISRTDSEETDRIRGITDTLVTEKKLVSNGYRFNLA